MSLKQYSHHTKKKILLMDFCPETNRGDAIMQMGLIRLFKEYFKEPPIALATMGANQSKTFFQEYDHSLKENSVILGGLRPTFFGRSSTLVMEMLNVLGFISGLVLVLMTKSKIPVAWVKRVLMRPFQPSFQQFVDSDFIIWKGRNFRSRTNKLLDIYRTIYLMFPVMLSRAMGKPIGAISISIWMPKYKITKWLLRKNLSYCKFITVREKYSFDIATQVLNLQNVRLEPDLSFAAIDIETLHSLRAISKKGNTSQLRKMGLTIMDWGNKQGKERMQYINALQETVRWAVDQGIEVLIIPQVVKTWENTTHLLAHILQNLTLEQRQKVKEISGNPKVFELLKIYASIDLLIATRMHSAVLASMTGTPAIAIAYDNGSKWGILEELGLSKCLLEYSRVDAHQLKQIIEFCWRNRESFSLQLTKQTDHNIHRAKQNFFYFEAWHQ